MFEKSLSDMVKGIRLHRRNPSTYISTAILECKSELRDANEFVKANAIRKLTFLRMMGYEFSWANFATIEVMSSSRFGHKRIGYLNATQSFTEDTDVILLCTNLLKKEFTSNNVYEVGLAINCLSNIVTQDLARELLPDLTRLTQHSHGYIRKKSLLALFKLFMKYPQGLRLTFDRIKQCLTDSDAAVVSCAVNVITELADKNPRNYLAMAPSFFNLLTESSNNWMLIKVVKLLGSLVSEEPRLARKLLEPLAQIVQNTQAKSLLYESVFTLTLALPYAKKSDGSQPKSVPSIVTLCADKLRQFVEEFDQNLKYLGLVGFVSLMRSHPATVVNERNLILRCLTDDDVTIRSRALELLTGMVTKKNLQELVNQLMQHVRLSEGPYRDELISQIIFMCSREKYRDMPDFKWYVDILIRISELHGSEHGTLIADQIIDVSLRVLPIRAYVIESLARVVLLSDLAMGKSKNTIPEVLRAAAWVVGEFSSFLTALPAAPPLFTPPHTGLYHALIATLLDRRALSLPCHTQSVYAQSATKIFASACASPTTTGPELAACLSVFDKNLPLWMQSKHMEVQERATSTCSLLSELNLLHVIPAPTKPSLAADAPAPAAATTTDLFDLSMDGPSEGTLTLDNDASPDMLTLASDDQFGTILPAATIALCRQHAQLLLSLCAPEPMKPINAKAQRKVPVSASWNLDAEVDNGLYKSLWKQDAAQLKKRKVTIEEVYFGSYKHRPVVTDHPEPTNGGGEGAEETERTSFAGQARATQPASSTDRPNETPYYLSKSSDGEESETVEVPTNFASIQLDVVSDDDDEGGRRKKEKKRKKSKKKERMTDDSFSMKADAMAIFGGDVAMYKSDDDDDVDANAGGGGGSSTLFDGLAKVDLTTPLAPDEVMEERTHREVPPSVERPVETAEEFPEEFSKKKKKEKKEKKEKGAKGTKGVEVDDLLDFGSDAATKAAAGAIFGADVFSAPPAAAPPLASSSSNSPVSPDTAASLDEIMMEFQSAKFHEHSAKVTAAGGGDVIARLAALLNCAVVPGSNMGGNATLAAVTASGAKVRILVKTKGNSAKLDIRSSDKKVGKAVREVAKSAGSI